MTARAGVRLLALPPSALAREIESGLERTPASSWFIYDGIGGELGFARAIYENYEAVAERARELIANCDCGTSTAARPA